MEHLAALSPARTQACNLSRLFELYAVVYQLGGCRIPSELASSRYRCKVASKFIPARWGNYQLASTTTSNVYRSRRIVWLHENHGVDVCSVGHRRSVSLRCRRRWDGRRDRCQWVRGGDAVPPQGVGRDGPRFDPTLTIRYPTRCCLFLSKI